MKNKNITLLIVFAAALIGWFLYSKYRVAPKMDFFATEVYDVNGSRADLQQFRGKKIIVTYWATWCGQCLKELKVLSEIKDTKLADVEVIAITDDDAETMKGFVERKNYPFRFYRINKRFSDMGINAIPVNYLINTNGQTVFDKVGSPDWTDDAFILKAKAMME